MESSSPDISPEPMAFLESRAASSPLAVMAFRELLEIQPAFEATVQSASWREDDFWADAEARCREILHFCGGDQQKFRAAVFEWVKFSCEFLLKQRKFLKQGKYAGESFEAIRRDLYDNAEKMKNFYLISLMFSFLFSSNYIGFFSFFRRQLIPRVAAAASVCDVGCGHGVYLAQMLLAAKQARGVGVDISPASLEMTGRMLEFQQIAPDRIRLEPGDVQTRLSLDDASQDAVTCFEVIEHLERPAVAIGELRRVLKTGGVMCLSTAIRMESVDHIHLFQSPEEARQLVEAGGFKIVKDEVIPLSTANLSDPKTVQRLAADPRVALGYVMLAT